MQENNNYGKVIYMGDVQRQYLHEKIHEGVMDTGFTVLLAQQRHCGSQCKISRF
jgi:hypothetical protein